jgi:hypothetical protein
MEVMARPTPKAKANGVCPSRQNTEASGRRDQVGADDISRLRERALRYRENEHTACSEWSDQHVRAEVVASARQRENRHEAADSRDEGLLPRPCPTGRHAQSTFLCRAPSRLPSGDDIAMIPSGAVSNQTCAG